MRLTIQRMEISNFLSFAEEQFDFTAHKGLNLVCGKNNDIPTSKNGTGKSSLFAALCFSLYGDTQSKLKNGNIYNKYTGTKETRVVTWFKVDDKQYKIASGFGKYGAPYCQLLEIQDGNEIDLTKSSIAETRKWFEKEILHCDMSIFLRTVLLSSDQSYNFFRLSKGQKKEFIEKLFDISVFGDMYNFVHRDILDMDKIVLQHQSSLLALNKNADSYKEYIKKFNDDKNKKINEYNQTLSTLEHSYNELKNTHIQKNEEDVNKCEDAMNKLQEAAAAIQQKISLANADMHKLSISINKLSVKRDLHQKTIDKHKELLNKLCDDCKDVFSDYYNLTNAKNEIEKITNKLTEEQTKLDELTTTKDSFQNKYDVIIEKQHIINEKIQNLTSLYNQTAKQLDQFKNRIDLINSQIKELTDSVNPYISLNEVNEKHIEEENLILEDLSQKYKYLKFAEQIVSQDTLRKFIIKDLVVLLNNRIKYYLTRMGAKYTCIFDENMDYEFTTEGGSYEYDSFSSGERMRLTIAASFAFRDFLATRSNFTANILILDEYIDSNIDSLAIDKIIEILKDFNSMYKQNIFTISHRKELDPSIFDGIIQCVKSNNISKIEYLTV